ncbi:MAG: ATP-binding protein [Spirochaetes bacterium]|nr:ATP-binding protein [Spirochaetota bacterium]
MMEVKKGRIIVNEKFPSSPLNKYSIINDIIKKIKECSIPKTIDYDEVYLIIDEALTNAMEHGNHWDPLKKVKILVTHNDDYLLITIEDEGRGFNTENYEHTKGSSLNDRGRGIHIIKHFCKPYWNSAGNQINFSIDIE